MLHNRSHVTKRKYKKLRQREKKVYGMNKLYVSWHEIDRVQKLVRPKGIDDTKKGEISVPLQSVVDHQSTNIMELPDVKEKYQKLVDSGREFELTMFGKYGADGTQSKSEWNTADAGTMISYLCIK